MPNNILETIDGLKQQLDEYRPLPDDVVARVEQKLRIESNYHTNAIEGNSLTLGETRSLILHGLTAHGKPMRDHLDVEGHDAAVKAIEFAIKDEQGLTEAFIRSLHEVLLKEPYEVPAITPDGKPTTRLITIGQYKTAPNNVKTSTGQAAAGTGGVAGHDGGHTAGCVRDAAPRAAQGSDAGLGLVDP